MPGFYMRASFEELAIDLVRTEHGEGVRFCDLGFVYFRRRIQSSGSSYL